MPNSIKLLFAVLLSGCQLQSDTSNAKNEYELEIQNHQQKMNSEFADPELSPLLETDLETFTTLDFFDVDSTFRVEAVFIRTPGEQPFGMKTSTDRLPMYVKFGIAKFEIGGKQFSLSVFQNIDLVKREGFENYLFLPFTDLTSGMESYGGGRYIDLEKNDSASILIDFNKAYNPYCAYSHNYSCPVPPIENDLQIEIRAGVKAFKE